ncbi:MAG: mannose-1-phosphate guanylyltransferase [Planctomycetota bacterium]
MSQVHAVVMAGGSGTRFWPASRRNRPKQWLPLAAGRSLLEATIERLEGLVPADRIWIATNPEQAASLPRILPSFPAERVLMEPEPRDTAPCIAFAAASIEARSRGSTMVVLPADHLIEPKDAFQRMIRRGIALSADDRSLVTFGVAPDRPATGYGYIECGEPVDAASPAAALAASFREKPDAKTAASFLAAGNYLWNSGIFVWSIRALRRAMDAGDQRLASGFDSMLAAAAREDRQGVDDAFRGLQKTSVDYAIMEKAPRVVVVRAEVRWSDVGSFPALASVAPLDESGNAIAGADGAAHLTLESRGNVIYAEGGRTVALFGVDDLVVVAVDDAVMVCPKSRAEDLKRLVARVAESGRNDLL